MADVAAARREARRKRILENSHNRLQLISGKNTEIYPKASFPSVPTSNDNASIEDCTDFADPLSRHSYLNGSLSSEPTLSSLYHPNPEPLEEIIKSIENKPKPTLYEKLVMYKYDIVILSITLQFYSCILASDSSYFFLPLLIYDITKVLWLSNIEESKLASALLLMNGVSPAKVQSILRVVQLVSMIAKDLCVFLFTTACSQVFIVTMSDNLKT